MYAITGVTGQVGGATAEALLASGQGIRAVVRDAAKGQKWRERGAEIALADFHDGAALAAAFSGADGVFVMLPANFTPEPGFADSHAIVQALRSALEKARPAKIVALSSVGAQHDKGLGLITQLHILEQGLAGLGIPSAFIRAAWFMENSTWDLPSAQSESKILSFLQPLDRPFPMVATRDIGRVIAETLQQDWSGQRIIEIEGPRRYSQLDIAAVFSELLKQPIRPEVVARERWAEIFESQGTAAEFCTPRLEMLDGFNSGWIDFKGQGTEHISGETPLEQILSGALN